MEDERSRRPMEPEFDPFPIAVPDSDPTPPVVVGYVEGAVGTRSCESDDEMPESFGAPVFLPRRWPVGAIVERRLVVRPGLPPSERDRNYLVMARSSETDSPMLVHGYFGTSPYDADADGCWVPEELAGVNGVVFAAGGHANASLEIEGQCILFLHFPSVAAVVSSATSLERLVPPGRA